MTFIDINTGKYISNSDNDEDLNECIKWAEKHKNWETLIDDYINSINKMKNEIKKGLKKIKI